MIVIKRFWLGQGSCWIKKQGPYLRTKYVKMSTMSTTIQDVMYDEHISSTVDYYGKLINELNGCVSNTEFKLKIEEINIYLSENEDIFGKGAKFLSSGVLENISVLEITEKIFNKQNDENKISKFRFWLSLVIGFFLGFIANFLTSLIVK